MRLSFIILLFLYSSSYSQLIRKEGFENGTPSLYHWAQEALPGAISVSTDQARYGQYSMKAQINLSDALGGGSLSRHRAEIKRSAETETERWYSISIFIPNSWTIDTKEDIVWQWHGSSDAQDNQSGPPLSFRIANDNWKMIIKWDTMAVSDGTTAQTVNFNTQLGAVTKNAWTDYVVHVKWIWSSTTGLVEVWQNTGAGFVKKITYNGRIGYNDAALPYEKIGIYKPDWTQDPAPNTVSSRTCYYDEVAVGDKYAALTIMQPNSVIAPSTVLNNKWTVINVPVKTGIDTGNIYLSHYPDQVKQALIYLPPARLLTGGAKFAFIGAQHGRMLSSTTDVTDVLNNGMPHYVDAGDLPIWVNPTTGDTTWFIIVSPHDAKGKALDGSTTGGFTVEYDEWKYILPYLEANYPIDTAKEFFCGYSAGGQATFSMICENVNVARKFKAVVAASAAGKYRSSSALQNFTTYKIPIYQFAGDADVTVDYSIDSTYWVNIQKYNPPMPNVLVKIPGGTHGGSTWSPAFKANQHYYSGGNNIYGFFAQYIPSTTVQPIEAITNGDQTIVAPTSSVTLDGSTSTGIINTVKWSKVSGTGGTITNSTNLVATASGLSVGTYVYRLIISNDTQADTALVNITVNNPPKPVASLTAIPSTVTLSGASTTVTLDARATAGTNVTYHMSKVSGGTCTITYPDSSLTTAVISQSGTYVFKVVATNSGGKDSATATVIVQDPSVTAPDIVAVANYTIYDPQDTIQLSATVTDTNTPPLSTTVSWQYISGASDVSFDTPTATSTWVRGLEDGVYQFKVTATNSKSKSTSKTIIVYVTAPPSNDCVCP